MTGRSGVWFLLVLVASGLYLRGLHCARVARDLEAELVMLRSARDDLAARTPATVEPVPALPKVVPPPVESQMESRVESRVESPVSEVAARIAVSPAPPARTREPVPAVRERSFSVEPDLGSAPRVTALITSGTRCCVHVRWARARAQWLVEGDESRGWELVHAARERVILHGPHREARVVWTPSPP